MSYGLLLISHGSPLESWNDNQKMLRDEVEQALAGSDNDIFKSVKFGWLEFAKPDIADCCEEFEKEGVKRIIAVPVFISVSSHSMRDIPDALGIMWHPVDDENSEHRYMGSVPVTLAPSLDHGSLLVDIVSDNAKELVKEGEAAHTGIVVVSHGDGCEHFWGHLHERIRHAIKDKTGVEDAVRCTIQTARKPNAQKNLIDAVRRLEEQGRSLIVVVSCFNGSSGETFIERVQRMYLGEEQFCKKPDTVLVGDKVWTRDPRLCAHIVNLALNAARRMLGRPVEGLEKKDAYPPYNPPFYHTRDKGKSLEEIYPANYPGKNGKNGGKKGGSINGKGDSMNGKGSQS